MKLTDTQLIMLSAAAQRADHALEISPDADPVATEKMVAKLAGAGLIEEVEAGSTLPAWRRVEEVGYALRITNEGLNAIGVDESADKAAEGQFSIQVAAAERRPAPSRKSRGAGPRKEAAKNSGKRKQSTKAVTKADRARSSKGRPGTKLDQVKALLARKRGASIAEMMEATSWLPHTTRAVLTGLRKKGFQIEREAIKDKPTIYRIVGGENSSALAERQSSRAA
jgi:hypothetical protein